MRDASLALTPYSINSFLSPSRKRKWTRAKCAQDSSQVSYALKEGCRIDRWCLCMGRALQAARRGFARRPLPRFFYDPPGTPNALPKPKMIILLHLFFFATTPTSLRTPSGMKCGLVWRPVPSRLCSSEAVTSYYTRSSPPSASFPYAGSESEHFNVSTFISPPVLQCKRQLKTIGSLPYFCMSLPSSR